MSLRERLARVVPVTLLVSVALSLASLDNDDYCGTVGECLGTAFDDAAVIALSLLLGPLLLWASRLPRVLAHTAAAAVALGSLWYAAGELRLALVPGLDHDAPTPWVAALLVGTLAALAATYAVGPGGRWQVRVVVLAATPLLAVLAHLVAEQLQASGEAAELERSGLVLYSPVIAGEGPERASVLDGTVQLSYRLEGDDGPSTVTLTITEESLDLVDLEGRVEVVREGGVLTADFDPRVVTEDEVRSALEQADPVPAAELLD